VGRSWGSRGRADTTRQGAYGLGIRVEVRAKMEDWIRTIPLQSLSLKGADLELLEGNLIVDWSGDWFVRATVSTEIPHEMVGSERVPCEITTDEGRLMGGSVESGVRWDGLVTKVKLKGISRLHGFDFHDFDESPAAAAGARVIRLSELVRKSLAGSPGGGS
jgi:hypothetical protein